MIHRSVAAVLFAALAVSAAGAADSPAAVRKALQKEYVAAARAFKKHDVEALMKTAAPDMTSRRPSGQVWNRKQIQVYMNLAVGALKTVDRAQFRVKSVKQEGEEVVATVDHTVAGTLNGGKGKPRRIVDVSTDRDRWVKTPDGWKIKFTECLKENVTIDGKRVDPMAGQGSKDQHVPPPGQFRPRDDRHE